MKQSSQSAAAKTGMAPGSLVFVGDRKVDHVTLNLMDYDLENFIFDADVSDLSALKSYRKTDSVTWINVYGLHDVDLLRRIAELFSIDPLIMEDILNTGQRPKLEVYGDQVSVVTKMIWIDEEVSDLKIEQISLIMNSRCVICFQEWNGDIFSPLRKRIREGGGRARHSGTDYLMYAICDVIVDNYFLVLEKLSDRIEMLDEEVLDNPDIRSVEKINRLKRDLLFIRKATWPMREVVSGLMREETPHFREKTIPYLRDLYDHLVQVIDTVETYRDMAGSLLDMYMSQVSNRMNEVMKVLTIIATIFIPLTFIAGIYGMNFERMPELHWSFGYPVVMVVMVVLSIIMLLFFRRKGWL